MNILVYDIAASEGGALSVLHEFYSKCVEDKSNFFVFILSTPVFPSTDNIKVLNFKWIKKSWLHRLFFDYFKANLLVSKYKIDKIISLQNIIVPNVNCTQTVLVHNCFPFVKYKFSPINETSLWLYKHIISYFIKKSIKHADRVIVQTKWMKNACIEKCHVNSNKVIIEKASVDLKLIRSFNKKSLKLKQFFFPATPLSYKNHWVIVKACKLLESQGISNYSIGFTFLGNENSYANSILEYCKKNNLPIEFKGSVKREELFEYYSKSVLIFPSLVETVGLPLLEAKESGCPIIVADTEFAREVLSGYSSVIFFGETDYIGLSNIIKYYIGVN